MKARKGLTQDEYAARIGRDARAVRAGIKTGAVIRHPDGSIDPEASDAMRASMPPPPPGRGRQRKASAAAPREAEAPPPAKVADALADLEAAGAALHALRSAGRLSLIDLRRAIEWLRAERYRIEIDHASGVLVDRARAVALVEGLAARERAAWVTWPARVAPLIAGDLGADPHAVLTLLERCVRQHLEEMAEVGVAFD